MKAIFTFLIIQLSFTVAAFTGVYEIPTENEKERPFAVHEVEEISFSTDSLAFKLPPQVASERALLVEFERDLENPNQFNSVFGTSKCLQQNFSQIKCEVRYNKIYSDFLKSVLPDTFAHIEDMQIPFEQQTIMKDLGRRFSGDPIGFLIIDLY